MSDRIEHLGQAPIAAIRDLLIGAKDFEEAKTEIQEKSKFQENSAANSPVALLFKRYDPRPTCVKIARSGAWDRALPALQLSVEKETWLLEPFLLQPEFLAEEDRYTVGIPDHWVNLLLSYVEIEFNKVFTASDLNDDITRQLSQRKEFDECIRRFRRYGPSRFFSNGFDSQKWVIVSHWDDWNRAGMEWKSRQDELAKLEFALELSYLKRLCTKILKLDYVASRAGKGGRER